MPKKSKVEELTNLLKGLEAVTPDIKASAVVSLDEVMILSVLLHHADGHPGENARGCLVLLDVKQPAKFVPECL